MCWLHAAVLVLLIKLPLCYSFTIEEKNLVKALVFQFKPHHVLFATDRESFRSIELDFLFVLSQWIDIYELEQRGLGRRFVRCPTLVFVQSELAHNYFNKLSWVCAITK